MIRLGDICKKTENIKSTFCGTIDYIDISSVDNEKKAVISTQEYEYSAAPSRAKQLVEIGDILISNVRPNLNAVALITDKTNNTLVASTGYTVIRCNNTAYNKYVFFFCQYSGFVDLLTSQATGASYPAVNAGIIKNTEIPFPSLEKQHIIADTLDKLQSIITHRKQQLLKLDELVKARFVDMFGEPYNNPMHWTETTVGKECYYIKDGPHKSLSDIGKENGGHPFISVRNIVNHTIDFTSAKYISDEDYAEARKKCCPEKGDMLYSKGGTTGIAKLIDVDVEFANWVHIAVLKFDKHKLNGIFFEHMLNCDYCYEQSQRLTKGIANRDLVLSAMAKIRMYLPPLDLQEQFATFVEQTNKSKVV